jgi:hypothetical protein
MQHAQPPSPPTDLALSRGAASAARSNYRYPPRGAVGCSGLLGGCLPIHRLDRAPTRWLDRRRFRVLPESDPEVGAGPAEIHSVGSSVRLKEIVSRRQRTPMTYALIVHLWKLASDQDDLDAIGVDYGRPPPGRSGSKPRMPHRSCQRLRGRPPQGSHRKHTQTADPRPRGSTLGHQPCSPKSRR